MELNNNWKNAKQSLPLFDKDVLWYIKIKQDAYSYGHVSANSKFWTENIYTIISRIKTDSQKRPYLIMHQPNGEEMKIDLRDDLKSLCICLWTELPEY